MSAIDEYLANNARYAETFSGPLPMPPSKQIAVVACMDARLNVYALLGLGDGEAHVIRNAGGVITDDEIRSLAIQPAAARHPRDHADSPHRLRDADVHR
jgi:carbonic anhydrase